MRRVLIVDDEVLVRIGIKHSITWDQNGFELIGEASDGKEALEMIQKLAPDIVILDINMPVLNGIEVLRELKEQKYKGKVIVLTCFNEIEYARSAMKYGASDYVLKTTLNTDELLNALLDLEFDDNNSNEPLTLPSREKMSEEEAVTRILEGYESDFQSKKLKASNLYCILVKIEQLSEVLDRYKEKKPDFFYTSLHSMIGQVVAGQKECVYIQYKPNRCVIFLSFSGQPSTQECYLKIRAIVNHLAQVLKEYLALCIHIGVSSPLYTMQLCKAYEEAEIAIQESFILPESSIFYYEEMNEVEQKTEFRKSERALEKAITDKNSTQVWEETER